MIEESERHLKIDPQIEEELKLTDGSTASHDFIIPRDIGQRLSLHIKIQK
ncbi:MAG: hypothetical protein ACLRYY_07350 [Anaerobutyricum soehngenii]